MKILVIDDEPLICSVLDSFLKSVGHEVETLSCLEDTADLSYLATFDILVSDIKLPGMNGLEILQRLRQQNSPIFVILMSGHLDGAIRDAVQALGSTACLSKPFSLLELSDIIARCERSSA